VLTGLDGDGLFRGWRWQRARAALARPGAAEPRDALRVALASAPPALRAAVLLSRLPAQRPWLRRPADWRVRARLAVAAGSEPSRWDTRIPWYASQRYLKLGLHSLALLAAAHHVDVVHPLLDPGVLAALAARGGRAGYGTREQAMGRLFGDLLPRALLARRTKAEFGAALWGEQARVDPEALARVWCRDNPPLAAATLLQAAWLA